MNFVPEADGHSSRARIRTKAPRRLAAAAIGFASKMYEARRQMFVRCAASAVVFTVIRLVALVGLYDVSKSNHLRMAGRFYDSFDQLGRDVAADFGLWRNPDLIRLADRPQRKCLESIRRWGMAGSLAWLTFAFVCIFALTFIVKAAGE